MARIRGGENVSRVLTQMADRLSRPVTVRVGFLENATYPDGKPVATVAAINEFGAPRAGIPPRPFFRNMIADKSHEWPAAVGDLLRENNYDVERALDLAGFAIAGQLRQSIQQTNSPPLAQSTIDRKGHSKPLIDSGNLYNSVDHEVVRR